MSDLAQIAEHEPPHADVVAPAPATPHADDSADVHHTSLREYLESLLVTIILALFGTSFVVQAFKIPSQSMEPTLLIGDHLLVNKFIFGGNGAWYEKILPYRAIRRGDVIVFKFPFDDHPHYVKRVIGIPGDRVKISDQVVFVNGKEIKESYVVHDPAAPYDPFGDTFPPTNEHFLRRLVRPEWADQILDYVQGDDIVVPPNKYFVMGDNRDRSWDSRYWGFVDRGAVMGAPMLIYWSIDSPEDATDEEPIGERVREAGNTLLHFRSRTRWQRMFHEVR
jgi:signal peptidase I